MIGKARYLFVVKWNDLLHSCDTGKILIYCVSTYSRGAFALWCIKIRNSHGHRHTGVVSPYSRKIALWRGGTGRSHPRELKGSARAQQQSELRKCSVCWILSFKMEAYSLVFSLYFVATLSLMCFRTNGICLLHRRWFVFPIASAFILLIVYF